MKERNLIISDKEYLLAERLSEAYMNEIVDAANEYIKIIRELVTNGIVDDNIRSSITHLCAPLFRLLQIYGNDDYNFINKKIQNYLSEIDKIDEFIY